jgi:RNA polymerase sigma-70 factor (ECF subfamily)
MASVTETRHKTELDLIAAGKRGDNAALTELFGRHYPECLRLARSILRSHEESEDAVQSACFSAFRHFQSFRGESAFQTWMTRLVINQCRMVLRKPARRMTWISLDAGDSGAQSIQLAAATPTPERSFLHKEIGFALADAIASLPEALREIFTLCEISDFTVREAAAVLGLTRAAAKTQLYRARLRMRARLKSFRGRLGSATTIRTDVRVICATHRNLVEMIDR